MADAPRKPGFRGPAGGGTAFPVEFALVGIAIVFLVFQLSGFFVEGAKDIAENAYVARFILSLKIISGITTVAAALLSICVVVRNNTFVAGREKRLPMVRADGRTVGEEWKEVEEHLANATDDDAPYIIIEADIVLDKALQVLRMPGESMGERIKYLQGQGFKYIQDLWEAHKIRNQIAHEGGAHITYSDAAYTLEKYKKVLAELGML